MTAHVPTAHEVETFTGRYVDTKRPKAETICLEDIAHALSNTCRYGGHCNPYYSVAEHAVFVAERLRRKGAPPWLQLAGLHHDDAEAYLGDIPRPMKSLLGRAYEILTDRMDKAIVGGLNLPLPGGWEDFHHALVKDADNWSLFVEARNLLPSQGINWSGSALEGWKLDAPSVSRIVIPDYWQGGASPRKAKRMFIERHDALIKEV